MSDNHTGDQLLRVVLIVLAVLVLLPLLMMVFAMPMMGMMGWWGTGGGVPPLWGIAMMLLFLAVILGVGYLLYRTVAPMQSSTDRALEELRMAYARGDLTHDEFDERRRRLE